MTKQEEIREGIENQVKLFFKGNPTEFKWSSNRLTQYIIEHLHSQGVVIKVERELPKRDWHEDWGGESGKTGYELALEDMAGYVAVKPLIKE